MFDTTRKKVAAAAILAVAIAPVTAVNAAAQDQGVDSSSTTLSADGREAYRGLFFGQGPVAEVLADNQDFSVLADSIEENSTPSAVSAADYVLDTIEAENPGYFESFGDRVYSGQPHLVKDALADGGTKLAESDWALEEVNAPENQALGVFVVAAVIHVAGLVTAAGAAVTVTLAVGANFVYAQNKFWGGKSATSSLSEEQAIGDLTRTLSA